MATSGNSLREFPDEAALRTAATDRPTFCPRTRSSSTPTSAMPCSGRWSRQRPERRTPSTCSGTSSTRSGCTTRDPSSRPHGRTSTRPATAPLPTRTRRIPIEHVDTDAMAAATGFYSTAEDMCRYASAHFLGDERLLSDRSKRLMQRTEWKVEGADSRLRPGLRDPGGRRPSAGRAWRRLSGAHHRHPVRPGGRVSPSAS